MTRNRGVVLVVEDSEECAATMEFALGALAGLSVCAVTTAELALSVIETADVAAIITDLHLPGMDGLDLLAYLRRHARWSGIPILIVSGDSDPRTPERAKAAGASAFFAKPYSPFAVRNKLEELIDAR